MKKDDKVPRLPVKLEPEPVERVWGGRAAERAFGWKAPEGKTIGEWWILSFRHDHPSWMGDGDFKGHPLPQFTEAHPELLGPDTSPALLVKILDSAQALSVQVHPDDPLALEMGLDSGKTECWYYLESDPGAYIYCGIKEGVSTEKFFAMAAKNPSAEAMDQVMEKVIVQEGALSFISAGTVHAIGAGVFLMEVQQNSDTTFRIYDWGRPREVHIPEACRAVENSHPEPAEVNDGKEEGVLVSCARFQMIRYRFQKKGTFPPVGPVYAAITCTEGEGTLSCEGYSSAYRKGDTWFLPARCPALEIEDKKEAVWMLSRQQS